MTTYRPTNAAAADHAASLAPAQLGRALVATCLALAAVGGVLVCLRRVGGALVDPLPVASLWCLGLILALVAWSFRELVISRFDRGTAWAWALGLLPTIVLLVWLAGLPSAGIGPTVGFLLLVLAEEFWSWRRVAHRWPERALVVTKPVPQPRAPQGEMLEPADSLADEAISQHVVRRRDDAAGELIEGWLRAPIAKGQRYATAHLGICPPLASAPQCFAEPIDGPAAAVKIAQVLAVGVRFEIKLDEPAADETTVTIEFALQEMGADHADVTAKHP